MTLSAKESECVCGPYLPIGRKQKSITPLLRLFLEEGLVSLGPCVGREGASTAGLLSCYLYLPTQGPRLWD